MSNRYALAVLAGLTAVSFTSCESLKQSINPQPQLQPARPRALIPRDFLFTDYAPLNDWLDQSVSVDIVDVPLSSVFQQPALAGLNHNLTNMPEGDAEPKLTISEIALTRRQLLWSISQDHKLVMTPRFDPQGGTSHIDITAK